jgi:hypothetical protein
LNSGNKTFGKPLDNLFPRRLQLTVQIPVDTDAVIGAEQSDGTTEIAPDLAFRRLMIANVIMAGQPTQGTKNGFSLMLASQDRQTP